MILGDFGPMSDQAAVKATLDDLFRGALARRPDAIALLGALAVTQAAQAKASASAASAAK